MANLKHRKTPGPPARRFQVAGPRVEGETDDALSRFTAKLNTELALISDEIAKLRTDIPDVSDFVRSDELSDAITTINEETILTSEGEATQGGGGKKGAREAAEAAIENAAADAAPPAVAAASALGTTTDPFQFSLEDHTHRALLDDISNPSGDTSFTMANKSLSFTWTAPTALALELEMTGEFTGDLLHVHQHTGNVGAGTHLVHVEGVDADAHGVHVDVHATGLALHIAQGLFQWDTAPALVVDPDKFVGIDANDQLGFRTGAELASDIVSSIDHGDLEAVSLTHDDHLQYALLAGRGASQTLIGAVGAAGGLILQSTAHATRGTIFLGSALTSGYDEKNTLFGIGTANPAAQITAYRDDVAVSPQLRVEQDGTGDATMVFMFSGLGGWTLGMDNDDGDKLKFAISTGDVGVSPIMTLTRTGEVGIGNTTATTMLSIGAGEEFRVDSSGDLVRINDVPYTWPAADTAGSLTSDGASNLSWTAMQPLNANLTEIAALANATGGILYTDAVPEWNLLAAGDNDDVLQLKAGLPVWRSMAELADDIEGSVDHGNLAGIGDDDHTQYALLAGRAGAANDLTLSTSQDGELEGSTNAGSDLVLRSNTANDGILDIEDPINVVTAGRTFDNDALIPTAAQSLALACIGIDAQNTITLSGDFPTYRLVASEGTIHLTESNGNPFSMGALFGHNLTYTNADGFNPGPVYTLVDQPIFNVDTTSGNRALGGHIGLLSNLSLTRSAGANTPTLGFDAALQSALTVGANCVVTLRYGASIVEATGAGTVTTQVGLNVANLEFATTNYSVRTGTAPTYLGNAQAQTITGAVANGYASSLLLDPGYTSAGANAVAIHNYIDMQDPSGAGVGPASITDAAVMRFDAAIGTHKAVASPGAVAVTIGSGPTGAAASDPAAWVKVNINGAIYWLAAWGA
jgi:hypothetical protein